MVPVSYMRLLLHLHELFQQELLKAGRDKLSKRPQNGENCMAAVAR